MWDVFYGRFPFDQIFWSEIAGIPCDEWNSIFRFLGLTSQWSSSSKFRAKIRNRTEDSFTYVYLLSGYSIDDAEVEINHKVLILSYLILSYVLGEGDIITFIVRI